MRLIYAVFIFLLALMTSANCQQTAEGWLSDLDPNLVVSWIEKGVALHNLSRYDEAVRALDEAIKLDPNYADAWNTKGVVLRNQGQSLDDLDIGLDGQDKYDEAMKCFDEAIRLNPNNAMVWRQKGVALYKMGRDTEAEAAYVRAKELEYEG